MTILIVAEHDGRAPSPAVLNLLTAAKGFGEPIDLLIAGSNVAAVANAATALPGVTNVLLADGPAHADGLPENLTPVIAGLVRERGYAAVLFAATSTGKGLAPRVAASLDVQQISEVTAVLSPDTFERPIYAGNALATVRSLDPIKILTVRASAFEPAEETGGNATVVPVAAGADRGLSRLVSRDRVETGRPDLTRARVVVSGGRGVGSKEGFALVGRLADALGGAVGATRAAVDAGYAPNDLQVGQTGKAVAPRLYIALGLSGAVQHVAGMRDSGVIVAINKDGDAPIFQVADFGVVGDLFTVASEIISELNDE